MPRTVRDSSPTQTTFVILGLTKFLCVDARSLMRIEISGFNYWIYTCLTSWLVRKWLSGYGALAMYDFFDSRSNTILLCIWCQSHFITKSPAWGLASLILCSCTLFAAASRYAIFVVLNDNRRLLILNIVVAIYGASLRALVARMAICQVIHLLFIDLTLVSNRCWLMSHIL